MSMQSDIEVLSIQAMETYASKMKLDVNEVNVLFHKHQVNNQVSFHTVKALHCLKKVGRNVYE